MNRERLTEALEGALGELAGERGGERALQRGRAVARAAEGQGGRAARCRRSARWSGRAVETREAISEIEAAVRELGNAPRSAREDRGAASSRSGRLARKHNVTVDGLAGLRAEIAAKVAALDDGGDAVEKLAREAAEARKDYIACRRQGLGPAPQARRAALDAAVSKELKPLKLDKARFATVLSRARRSRMGRVTAASACISRSRPIPARRRGRSPRSPRAASCRASCWRSRWCWPGPRRCRRWSSTRSTAASAARSAAAVGERLHRLGQRAAGAGGDPFAAGGGARRASLAGRKEPGGAEDPDPGRGAFGRGAARGDRPHAVGRRHHRRGARRGGRA